MDDKIKCIHAKVFTWPCTLRSSIVVKRIRSLTLIAFAMLNVFALYGQTVDQLIELARQNNPSLEVLDGRYRAAKYKGDQVAVYPDPQLALAFGAFPVETRLGSQQMRLGLSQRLLWKGELSAKRSLEDARAEVLAFHSEAKEIDLAYTIRQSFFELVFIDRSMSLVRSKLEILEILENLARDAIESGKGRLSNVLLVRRMKEDFNSRLEELEIRKKYFTIQINHAIGRAPETVVVPDTTGQRSWDTPVLTNPEFVEQTHPRLKTFENFRSVSEKAIDLTHYAAKPKVMVGLEYVMIHQRPGIEIMNNGRDVLMPMGTVSIPIHKRQYEAKRQEEMIRIGTIDASIENTKNDFYAEISQAKTVLEESDVVIEKNTALKELTESTIDLMKTEYINDGSRFEELLRLEMEQIQYDIEIERARKQKRIAYASLGKYTNQ